MNDEQDRAFMKNFATVVGILVAVTVVLLVLANWLGGWIDDREAQRMELERERIAERIQPVGRLRWAGEPLPEREEPVVEEAPEMPEEPPVADVEPEPEPESEAVPEVAEAWADEEPYEGRPPAEIYQSVCQACHLIGVADAPKLDDPDAWRRVLDARGLDGIISSVIQGRGAMPARAGRPGLTDAEIRQTVLWILDEAGGEP